MVSLLVSVRVRVSKKYRVLIGNSCDLQVLGHVPVHLSYVWRLEDWTPKFVTKSPEIWLRRTFYAVIK